MAFPACCCIKLPYNSASYFLRSLTIASATLFTFGTFSRFKISIIPERTSFAATFELIVKYLTPRASAIIGFSTPDILLTIFVSNGDSGSHCPFFTPNNCSKDVTG